MAKKEPKTIDGKIRKGESGDGRTKGSTIEKKQIEEVFGKKKKR